MGKKKKSRKSFDNFELGQERELTQRERFLQTMETVVPFSALLQQLEPLYEQGEVFQGERPPYPAEMMLRIFLMQCWWSLSADVMEDCLTDIRPFQRFAGIDPAKDPVPDAATILAFDHFLENNQLTETISKQVEEQLSEHELILKKGTIDFPTTILLPKELEEERESQDLLDSPEETA